MKAKAKANVEAKVAVQVSTKVLAELKALTSIDAQASALVTKREATTLQLGDTIAKEHKGADRDAVRDAYAPLFVSAYEKANRDESYAKQQLSRIIGFAFPGGLKGWNDPKKADAAKAELAKGKAAKLGVLELASLASGNAKYRNGKVVKVKRSSGGGNADTPLQTLEKALRSCISGAEVAKLDYEQVRNTFFNVLAESDRYAKAARKDSENLA